jgi:hypothetical protein
MLTQRATETFQGPEGNYPSFDFFVLASSQADTETETTITIVMESAFCVDFFFFNTVFILE